MNAILALVANVTGTAPMTALLTILGDIWTVQNASSTSFSTQSAASTSYAEQATTTTEYLVQ
jgi:hypothetical protein